MQPKRSTQLQRLDFEKHCTSKVQIQYIATNPMNEAKYYKRHGFNFQHIEPRFMDREGDDQ